MKGESFATAPTRFVTSASGVRYGYRRFGAESGPPLLFLQHFMGTMDHWDPAITDPLSESRPVILFDNAGVGQSEGKPADTVRAMAGHVIAFCDALRLNEVDLLGFSLGGMVAQEVALKRPTLVRQLVLVGTAPEGGEDMSMLKPEVLATLTDPTADWNNRVRRLFFPLTTTGETAARALAERQATRTADKAPMSGEAVFNSQAGAIVAWEKDIQGERFARLVRIASPTLVVNGSRDIMIPTRNSFLLSDRLPNAQLVIYPNSGHGSLFQHHSAFTHLVSDFLNG